jgi:hypothetical protein
MRLAGQIKAGFFPAPSEVTELIARHLTVPHADKIAILDPCAGEGLAITQLGDYLAMSHRWIHAVELNRARTERIAEAYPEVKLLGPCSYLSSRISSKSFSLIYCNPPFDSEFGGGGREETTFVLRSIPLLVPGGVFILVCPINQIVGNEKMATLLDMAFDDIEVYLFPDEHRKYRECVLFGKKRKKPLPVSKLSEHGTLHQRGLACSARGGESCPVLGEPAFSKWDYGRPDPGSRKPELDVWELRPAQGPETFTKLALTQEEVEEILSESVLYQVLESTAVVNKRRPPLPLSKAHTSLLLIAGELDGYLASDPPQVVRGYCGKKKQLKSITVTESENGAITETKKIVDVPMPVLRAIWPDGRLVEYRNAPPADEPITENGGNDEELEEYEEDEDA